MAELMAILLFVSICVALMAGFPVAFTLAGVSLLFAAIGVVTGTFDPGYLSALPNRLFGIMNNQTMLAVPLFVFMGVMLERSRVAEDLLESMSRLFGTLRGGLAISVCVVGALLAASTGIVGATVVTIGLLTLPVLLRRGYKPSVACGTICASGTLGQIIPPSLVLILLADILGESVGSIFAAAFIPSLMLAGVYIVYMLLLGWLRPQWVPAIPAEERALISRKQLWQNIAKSVLPPLLLVVCVLGSIIGGLAAPTEAASIGALGALVIAGCARRLNRDTLKQTLHGTLSISAMIFLILLCSQPFSLAFRGLGGEALVHDLFSLLPGGELGAILFLMVLLFVLGFFLEWIEISYIALPMFLPVFMGYGTDMVWLAILVALNLQMSFLTPPFGWALFFLKGVAPPGISTKDIYIGALPFVALQMLAVALVFAFPTLATWLPKAIGW